MTGVIAFEYLEHMANGGREQVPCEACGGSGVIRAPQNNGDDSNDHEEPCPECDDGYQGDYETTPFERVEPALEQRFDFGGES